MTSDKVLDFNTIDLTADSFKVNISIVLNNELSKAIDYYYEREDNGAHLHYSNNTLTISYQTDINYSYQVIADGLTISSSNFASEDTEIAIGNYDNVVVIVKQLGDNIFYIDSESKEYEINLVDSLSYNIIDGSKVKVNGYKSEYSVYINASDLGFRYSYLNGNYFSDGFRLLDLVDDISSRNVEIYEEFEINEGTNLVSRTIVVDFSSRLITNVNLAVADTYAYITNPDRLAKYEYKIVAAGASFYDGEGIYEYNFSDEINLSDLEAGVYHILVRQKGQSDKFSSEWTSHTFLSFKDLTIEYEVAPEPNYQYSILTIEQFANYDLMSEITFVVNLNDIRIYPELFTKNIFHLENIPKDENYELTIEINFNSTYLYIVEDKPTKIDVELNRYKYVYNESSYDKDFFILNTDTETVLPTPLREIYANTLCEIKTDVSGSTTTYTSILDTQDGFIKVSFIKEDDFVFETLLVDSEVDIIGYEEEIKYMIMKIDSSIIDNLSVFVLPELFSFNIKDYSGEYVQISEDQLVTNDLEIYIKGYAL